MRHRPPIDSVARRRPTAARRSPAMLSAIGLLGTASLLLAGCGGDDDQDAATTTTVATVEAEQWVRTVQDGCTELNERYADLAGAQPTDREEAVAYAQRVEDFSGELVELFDGAGAPRGRGADAELFLDTVHELDDAAAALAEAAQQGDAEAAGEAATRLGEMGDRLNPLADELGITACGGF